MVMAAASSDQRSLVSIFLLIVLGLIGWELGEYILHRFAFHYHTHSKHSRWYLQTMHLAHHDDPQSTAQLFVTLWMSAPIAVGFCLLAWTTTRDWHCMAYLFMGLVGGYSSY